MTADEVDRELRAKGYQECVNGDCYVGPKNIHVCGEAIELLPDLDAKKFIKTLPGIPK